MEHLILLGILLVLGFAICGVAIVLIRHCRNPQATYRNPKDGPSWFSGIALGIALLGLYAWADDRDARVIAEINAEREAVAAGYLPDRKSSMRVNLNDCPPRSDGMTDHVIMVIATRTDGKHTITGCARIAQRQYTIQQSKQIKG